MMAMDLSGTGAGRVLWPPQLEEVVFSTQRLAMRGKDLRGPFFLQYAHWLCLSRNGTIWGVCVGGASWPESSLLSGVTLRWSPGYGSQYLSFLFFFFFSSLVLFSLLRPVLTIKNLEGFWHQGSLRAPGSSFQLLELLLNIWHNLSYELYSQECLALIRLWVYVSIFSKGFREPVKIYSQISSLQTVLFLFFVFFQDPSAFSQVVVSI